MDNRPKKPSNLSVYCPDQRYDRTPELPCPEQRIWMLYIFEFLFQGFKTNLTKMAKQKTKIFTYLSEKSVQRNRATSLGVGNQ